MMQFIVEPERKVSVVARTQVAVIGGGTAGLPAALAAARAGAEVILVERYGYLGGQATGGLVITVPRICTIGGICDEIYGRLIGMDAAVDKEDDEGGTIIVSAEVMKYVADAMVEEAEVRPLFHSLAVSALVNDKRVEGVILENKAGRQAILADIVVDATGDADVAALAGAPYLKGDEDGKMLGVTTMYLVANVDREKWEKHSQTAGESLDRVGYAAFTDVNPGEVNCWSGRIEGDGVDPEDLTRMEIELRKWVMRDVEERKKVPGFESAYLSALAPQLGVRETRRIVGEYVYSDEDWEEQTVFSDSIGIAYDRTLPYGCIVPQEVDNLLVAGRCISTSKNMQGQMRIIPPCMTTGQAAGAAAALCAGDHVTPRDLSVPRLQEELRRQGVELGV